MTGRNLGGAARCQSVRSNRVDVCAMLLGIEGRATYLIRFPYERSKKDEAGRGAATAVVVVQDKVLKQLWQRRGSDRPHVFAQRTMMPM